jgi:hypothetical protein
MTTSTDITRTVIEGSTRLGQTFLDESQKQAAALFAPLLKAFLSPLIPTIIIGIVLIVVFVVFLAMTFDRVRRSNGLSPDTNRFIGSISYLIVHSGVIYICWQIWQLDMLEKSIFYMLHLIAFMLVRIILLATKVWVY